MFFSQWWYNNFNLAAKCHSPHACFSPCKDLRSSRITTGNSDFAECRKLCRVANHGHSAKRLFAECQTTHSANISLPSVCLSAKISTQQRAVLGKGWPGQTASVVVPFAECPAVRHSAKEPPLPSAKHSAKACHVAGLGSARATAFAECQVDRHSAKSSLPSANPSTRQSVIFFLIFLPKFFVGP